MFENTQPLGANLIKITGEIVSAYVARNHVSAAEIPMLLSSVHTALTCLANETTTTLVNLKIDKPTPVQIRKSITSKALISFIDGRPYKTLKRHLSVNGLSPRSYRERYGLPSDYPMVAASYSETRSALAKAIGLGQIGGSTRSRLA